MELRQMAFLKGVHVLTAGIFSALLISCGTYNKGVQGNPTYRNCAGMKLLVIPQNQTQLEYISCMEKFAIAKQEKRPAEHIYPSKIKKIALSQRPKLINTANIPSLTDPHDKREELM